MKSDFLNSAVIYNVYPTSFYDSNGDGVGDIVGITQKLEYIKQFADIVWINPVFKSPFKDGGYDIEDYFEIDAKFGSIKDVEDLTDKAHALGMKIVFDLVAGHTSDKHKWFKESRKEKRNEYSDYYIWDDNVFEGHLVGMSGNAPRNGTYAVNFFCFQPALNYGYYKKEYSWQFDYKDERLSALHNKVVDIMKFWLDKGVDGFRCDMASSIVKNDVNGQGSCEIWRKLFGEVRKSYPQAIFISEWGQPEYAVGSGAFDIDFFTHCYNDGYNNLFRKESGCNIFDSSGDSYFRKGGKGECKTFFEYLEHNLSKVKDNGYVSVVSGNHDLPRISVGRDDDELKCAFAMILALPNVPLIYYGDEIGMGYNERLNKDGGYRRTGSRTPMQWSSDKNAGFSSAQKLYLPINRDYNKRNIDNYSKDEKSLYNTVKRLCQIRRESEALTADADFELISVGYPLIFKRTTQKESWEIIINPCKKPVTVKTTGKAEIYNNCIIKEDEIVFNESSFAWIQNPA